MSDKTHGENYKFNNHLMGKGDLGLVETACIPYQAPVSIFNRIVEATDKVEGAFDLLPEEIKKQLFRQTRIYFKKLDFGGLLRMRRLLKRYDEECAVLMSIYEVFGDYRCLKLRKHATEVMSAFEIVEMLLPRFEGYSGDDRRELAFRIIFAIENRCMNVVAYSLQLEHPSLFNRLSLIEKLATKIAIVDFERFAVMRKLTKDSVILAKIWKNHIHDKNNKTLVPVEQMKLLDRDSVLSEKRDKELFKNACAVYKNKNDYAHMRTLGDRKIKKNRVFEAMKQERLALGYGVRSIDRFIGGEFDIWIELQERS